jgi:hypothetical protein
MAIDTTTLPANGSKWEIGDKLVTVDGFKVKGRGGYILWNTYNSVGGQTKLSEWKAKAKAA